MLKKLLKFLIALLLLPLTLSTILNLPSVFSAMPNHWTSFTALFLGVFIYVLFEIIFNKPMRTYVFGHELTHALASVACGGKVYAFNVSKKGGDVSISHSNFFVSLAPYIIPIYTLFILLIYYLLSLWFPMEKYHAIFLGAIGFTMAFHASLTLFAIREGQPDIKKTGTFFSLIFITLINAWILILITKLLFWDLFSLKQFFRQTLSTQTKILQWLYTHILELIKK